jgi:hypothetical protein
MKLLHSQDKDGGFTFTFLFPFLATLALIEVPLPPMFAGSNADS